MRPGLLLAAVLAAGGPALAQTVPVPPERPAAPAAAVPIPEPRPAQGDAARPEPAPPASAPAARPPVEAPAVLSDADEEACRKTLRDNGVVFTPVPRISDGACGAEHPIRVTRLSEAVALSAPVTTLCRTAASLSAWAREEVQTAALREFGAPLTELRIGGSYECRNRNRAAQGTISEHAFANAVDVMGFAFVGRAALTVEALGRMPGAAAAPAGAAPPGGAPPVASAGAGTTAPAPGTTPEGRFFASVRAGSCRHFSTVLGPGTDAEHANHLHLDRRQRRNDYRLCQ